MSHVKLKKVPARTIPLETVEARVAKGIAEVISDSVKHLPKREQTRRLKNFCDALDAFLWPHANTSASSESDPSPVAAQRRP